MVWRVVGKGIVVTALLVGAVVGFWVGVVQIFFGGGWWSLFGVALFVASFRAVILAFDMMWGRPPVFSKRPWDRPWEQQAPGPPQHP
ncbi:MAG TPA: hypothetical protein VJA44_05110, partial [Acidimicrobiia bacterium]|nr:hypothetical protein [Acidimicrobiia bacterium]